MTTKIGCRITIRQYENNPRGCFNYINITKFKSIISHLSLSNYLFSWMVVKWKINIKLEIKFWTSCLQYQSPLTKDRIATQLQTNLVMPWIECLNYNQYPFFKNGYLLSNMGFMLSCYAWKYILASYPRGRTFHCKGYHTI